MRPGTVSPTCAIVHCRSCHWAIWPKIHGGSGGPRYCRLNIGTMASGSPETRAAYLEDFNEDTQVALPETRQTASTASTASTTANTTAKRSKPAVNRSNLPRDEFSDSGYSSHTAATLTSGESSSLTSHRGPAPGSADDANTDSNSTSTVKNSEGKTASRAQSPEKQTLRRTGSKSKAYAKTRTRICDCPKCLHKQAPRTAITADAAHPDTMDKQRSKTKKPLPPFPQLQRLSGPYIASEAPILEPAQQRPRAFTSSMPYQRTRPTSFHAGTVPEGFLMPTQPMMIERQPPSRYTMTSPLPPPSYPPEPSYFPTLQMHSQPHDHFAPSLSPYEAGPHPMARSWTVERPRPLRPQTMYYDASPSFFDFPQPMYEAAGPPIRLPERQRARRQSRTAMGGGQAAGEDEDYRRMPPPPKPRSKSRPRNEQRPLIRHAATASAAIPLPHFRAFTREQAEEQRPGRTSSRKQSLEEYPHSHSRRPSVARTPRTSDEKVMARLQQERDMASTRPRRRSVYGPESLRDLEGSIEEVEAYQASRGNMTGKSASTPIAEGSLGLTRKKTQAGSSDGGSRVSGHSKTSRDGGSDIRSFRRSSDEDKKRDNDDQGLEMRLPKGAHVKIHPGIEGRTVSVRSSRDGDGDMQLRIGERGRAAGIKPAGREKSRKRYSITDGQSIMDPDRQQNPTRLLEDARAEDADELPRRMFRERFNTASRSRRNSRNGYMQGEEGGFF